MSPCLWESKSEKDTVMVYNKDLPSDCQQDQDKALDKEDGREEVKTFRSVGLC